MGFPAGRSLKRTGGMQEHRKLPGKLHVKGPT